MFSSRFHWDLRPNRLTELLNARIGAGARIIDLTESNPTRAGFEYPAAILNAFADPRILLYEPLPSGLPDARTAVAAYYASRGNAVDRSRILLTASTSEAYAYLFKLLCNPGDQVLVPRPSYPLFEFLANMESVEVGQYSLRYHGEWSIDLDSLAAAASSKTRAIILVNPNNPTGSYLKRQELSHLVKFARDRGIALISDEVFSDYPLTGDDARVDTLVETEGCLSFSMSGFSKVLGLPQMKFGWIVVNGPAALQSQAMEKLEWIADTYLSVGTPIQWAAGLLFQAGASVTQQIRQRTRDNLSFAAATLSGSSASILHVEGGWYITVRVPRTRSEEEWALALLNDRDVLIQPGFFFDFESEAFLVMSLLTRTDVFQEGLMRLGQAIRPTPDH